MCCGILPGRDQHDVKADFALRVVRVVGEPEFGRRNDAALAALGYGFRCIVGARRAP